MRPEEEIATNYPVDGTHELARAVESLHKQLPITISELRQTISKNTDKVIDSNEKLAKSNEGYIKWMKWLTFGLFFVGLVQVIIQLSKEQWIQSVFGSMIK